ncbi:MAG: YegS/Rv2252/BmrU family lipid kinase [Candidatus Eremiobacteraeota bacterium]|nr:YegS/Rv2252/BmrU family lipid kinase [Candidatus Eremiobacteraeota bacterium]
MHRSAVVVGNLRSRNVPSVLDRVVARLPERGVAVEALCTVESGGELHAQVGRAIDAGAPLVVVAGGDGTLSSVTGLFAHRSSVLGVIPAGTGNSFARTLGIGLTVEDAVETIVAGRVAHVDLGVANGTAFANVATIGLGARAAREAPATVKRFAGVLAYVLATIPLSLRSRPFRAALRFDDEAPVEIVTHQLVVANGRYFGVAPLVPEATVVDGRLHLAGTASHSIWGTARLLLAQNLGRPRRVNDGVFRAASTIAIEAHPPQLVDLDGETLGVTPVRFSVDRGALAVMVPQAFGA